jgi:hypothetical protein
MLGRSSREGRRACQAEPHMGYAPGQWRSFFAASCFDGRAVAVEHWKEAS